MKQEMQLFDSTEYPSPNILKPCEALKTIPLTSAEAKKAFSAAGLFVTKLRTRLSDKRLCHTPPNLFHSSLEIKSFRSDLVPNIIVSSRKQSYASILHNIGPSFLNTFVARPHVKRKIWRTDYRCGQNCPHEEGKQ
ncbi:hypothetical protein TNCV_4266551 [Trichonephila clavipes]|nr:hypothetical protein TNCV_4266551 [Trichonephila clavipes]